MIDTALILAACLGAGLLDPEELSNAEYIDIGQRLVELQDAPPLADWRRFPSREAIDDRMSRWYKLRSIAAARAVLMLHHADSYRQIVAHCDRAIEALSELLTTPRRLALKRYRDLVGPDLYQTGLLP